MKRIQTITAVIALALLAAACSHRVQNQPADTAAYELLTIEKQNYSIESEYPASIQGKQDIRIIPRVDGYLESIRVKEGDRVAKGQVLFTIDAVQYKAAVKSAKAGVEQMKASLAKAQQDYDSKLVLNEKNIVSENSLLNSKNDLAVAKANLAAAEAALASSENSLSFTVLRSPSDGVIGKIPYRKGDYVGPSIQDGLTVVSDNDRMFVYFSMTESRLMEYLCEYKTMDNVLGNMPEVRLRLINGKEYGQTGRVESISGIVDDKTGSVSVRAVFDNKDGILLSGGSGRVVLPTEIQNAIIIPQEATYEIQDKVFVMKVVDGKTVACIVDVEKENNGKEYIVTDGLEAGDVIVAKGAGLVREGTQVKGE
jgi:membrane fusion protein, multidrug efflux system